MFTRRSVSPSHRSPKATTQLIAENRASQLAAAAQLAIARKWDRIFSEASRNRALRNCRSWALRPSLGPVKTGLPRLVRKGLSGCVNNATELPRKSVHSRLCVIQGKAFFARSVFRRVNHIQRNRGGFVELLACDRGRLASHSLASFAQIGIFEVRIGQGRSDASANCQSDCAQCQWLRLEEVGQIAPYIIQDVGRIRQPLCVFRAHAGRRFDTGAAGFTDRISRGIGGRRHTVPRRVESVLCCLRHAIDARPLQHIARSHSNFPAGEQPNDSHTDECRRHWIAAGGIAKVLEEVRTSFSHIGQRTISLAAALSRWISSIVAVGFSASPDNRVMPTTTRAIDTIAATPPEIKYATGSEKPACISAAAAANSNRTSAGIMITAPAPIIAPALPACPAFSDNSARATANSFPISFAS